MVKKLTRVVVALALVISTMLVTAAPTLAFASSCGQTVGSGTLYAVLYESDNYNDNFGQPAGPDYGVLCIRAASTGSTLVPNLKNVLYQVAGGDASCSGQLATSFNTWNDCISSFQIVLDCHHDFAFYQDSNYGSASYAYSWPGGSKSSLVFGQDNTFSSLKLTYHSACVG